MPKVSVIVPVYNVKEYLEKCVRSVLGQTEGGFELLLIDDGSTDGSGELCDRLAQTDPRIKVIHQENRGLGGARNTGIEAAAGEWLMFSDSDDWLEPETLERALAAGERENADLVAFPFRSVDETGKELHLFTEDVEKDKGLALGECKKILLTSPSACNKLYRKELFRRAGAVYPPRVWYEDVRTTPKLMAAAERMVFLDYVGYNYLQRTGSIMKNKNVERNGEIMDAFDDLLSWFEERGLLETYRDELGFFTLCNVYLMASVRVIRLAGSHPLLKRFAAYMKDRFPGYRSNPYLGTLTRNQRITVSLLDKKLYPLIGLIFKLKG